MPVTVLIGEAVRPTVGGVRAVEVNGSTVIQALVQASRLVPGLRLLNCDGEVRGVFRVTRGGAPVELEDAVADGDVLLLDTA